MYSRAKGICLNNPISELVIKCELGEKKASIFFSMCLVIKPKRSIQFFISRKEELVSFVKNLIGDCP